MKITNNFVLGDVNKSADERLIPNGSLRDLENIITNASEGKDKGALENVLGNKLIVNNDLPNAEVIGSAVNEAKRKVYYFVVDDNYDYIFEYDQKQDTNTRVLQTSKIGGLLNFDRNKRIVNIDVINKGSQGEGSPSFTQNDDFQINDIFISQANESFPIQAVYQFDEEVVSGSRLNIQFKLNNNGDEETFNFSFTFTSNSFTQNNARLFTELRDFLLDMILTFDKPLGSSEFLSQGSVLGIFPDNTVRINLPRYFFVDGGQNQNDGYTFNSVGFQIILVNEEDSDLLAFSGDHNEPRIINVERCKLYGIDEILPTDLMVIKPSPIKAPQIELFNDPTKGNNLQDRFLSFAYRYKYKDGYYSSKSSASEYAFSPKEFNIDFDNFENSGMQNIFNSVRIKYNTGDENVEQVDLLFKDSTSLNWSIIETINKEDDELGNNEIAEFVFANNKVYRTLAETEYFRSFDNVPLRANSQVYTQGRLIYGNYIEQRDLVDKDGAHCKIGFNVDFKADETFNDRVDVTNINITNNNLISGKRIKLDFSDATDIAGKSLIFDFSLNGFNFSDQLLDNIQFSYTYIIPENVSTLFDLVNNTDFAQKFENEVNDLVLNLVNKPAGTTETIIGVNSLRIEYGDTTTLRIVNASYNFIVPNTSSDFGLRYYEDDGNTFVVVRAETGTSSMKSNRDYEVAQIYLDEQGRKTTALTSKTNDVFIPNINSVTKNTLKVTIPQSQKPPKWAKYYKFAVKKTQEWENIYSNIFYEDGFFRWIKLEGSDVNKVNIGDDIICKRDISGILEEPVKLKVLDKQYFDENFIEGSVDANGNPIVEMRGQYIKVKPTNISLDYESGEFLRAEGGIVNDRTTSGQAHSFIGGNILPFESDIFSFLNENEEIEDRKITTGSVFSLDIRHTRSSRTTYTFNTRVVANQDYENILDFFQGEFPPQPDLPTETSNGQPLETPPTGGFRTNEDASELFLYWVVKGDIVFNASPSSQVLKDQENNEITSSLGSLGNADIRYKIELNTSGRFFLVIKAINGGNNSNRSKIYPKLNIRLIDGYTVFETQPKEIDDNVFYETPETYDIIDGEHEQSEHLLTKAFNCFVQGNGAESYQIKDQFNANKLIVDYTPTAVSNSPYRQLRRFSDITYSTGVFNDSSGVNGLNEFNLSQANFKDDLENMFGAINKMVARDTNIVVMQEDKISQVLLGKSEFFNADGSSSVSKIDTILGQQVPFVGEYGIDTDPESVVATKNNIYFTDKKRGVVCRLGYNGLFEISSRGMGSYFRNLFLENQITHIVGCYDDFYNVYMLNIKYIEKGEEKYITWGYKEDINETGGGWVTKQTFNPQEMIKYVNTFISFDKGNLYIHNAREEGDFNKFYGEEFYSSFKFIFSQEPYQRKVYKTIEIDGTDAWDIKLNTNLQNGYVALNDFRYQENIFRSYVRGEKDEVDYSTLNVQGIGILKFTTGNNELYFNSINPEFSVGDVLLNQQGELIGRSIDVNFELGFITLDEISEQLENPIEEGSFVLCAKPQNIETSGLLGYYLEVEAKLQKREKTEVFSVSSEVFASASNT